MYKSLFAALFLTSAMAATPTLAQDSCADEIERAEAVMPNQRDAGKAEMAEAQLKIARELEQKDDEEGCLKAVAKANAQLEMDDGAMDDDMSDDAMEEDM